jgi:hypothetical protein
LASPDRCAHVERLYHDMLAREEGERATPASWTCSDGRPPFHRLLSNVADEQHPIMRLQPFRKVGICSVQATLEFADHAFDTTWNAILEAAGFT